MTNFLQGWISYMMIAIVITKYFLWVDDDFVFLKGTRIESFVEIMEAVPELDIVRKWNFLVCNFHFISLW